MGRGNERFSARQGHMTKMAAMSIYDKNPLKSFQNQRANDLSVWYEALGMRVQESLFK